jgi:hypothetical protein
MQIFLQFATRLTAELKVEFRKQSVFAKEGVELPIAVLRIS